MEVIFLTTLFSVLFAVFFLTLFLRMRQAGESCADQDALLPFRGDKPSSSSPNPEGSPTGPFDSVSHDQRHDSKK
ncbi:MAG: hypothetical protein WD342_07990 [Verrucomicrobiales bacterium]